MNQIKRLGWEDKLNERIQIELTLEELLDIKLALGIVTQHTLLNVAKEIYDSPVYEELKRNPIHSDIYTNAETILEINGIEEKNGTILN
ncbi:hypothetical protein GCM10008931_44280 [Oceanobacillus oncorhynchi subsp. oncorhynchi]|uniref:hypothetical protein n=1 Tax=Oceanobacillus oncorhynchi TaxID=545501 RepID=UPI0031D72B32